MSDVCGLQSAVYSLQFPVCSLHSPVYTLQPALCSLHSVVYPLHSAVCKKIVLYRPILKRVTIDREMKSGVRGFKLPPDQWLVLIVLGSPKLNFLATKLAAWSAILNRIIAFTFVSLCFHWSGLADRLAWGSHQF